MSDLTIPQNQELIRRLQAQAERANAAATAVQPTNAREIERAGSRIRELERQLKQLPDQARTLKLAGKGKEARETLDTLEDVHIELGKAQIELARLEAEKAEKIRRAHQEASAGTNAVVFEAMTLSGEIKDQAERDLATIKGLAANMGQQGTNYQTAATDARRKLQDAERALKSLADGPVTSPVSKAPVGQVERAINLSY